MDLKPKGLPMIRLFFSLPMFLAVLVISIATTASAQQRDGVFADYTAYAAFVDQRIMSRDFVPLIKSLGGRDEYTEEQLTKVNAQLLKAFPVDFRNVSVFRRQDLGNGVSQEARLYWTGENYAFYYAILHQRAGELVVLNFKLNSSVEPIMKSF